MLPKICAYSEAAARDVLTVAQMRAAEQAFIAAGTPGLTLMERAGRAVVAEIERRCPVRSGSPRRAAILCGPGNNGGDGYVVARVLQGRGWSVDVYALVPRAALTGDARRMADLWDGLVHPAQAFRSLRDVDVVVDALFGTGLSRDLDHKSCRLLGIVAGVDQAGQGADAPLLRLAVDIPSGVDGDSGAILGAAFAADVTVTFHALKPGHLLLPGRQQAGDIVVADIGLGPDATAAGRHETDGPDISLNASAALVARIGDDPAGHKYTKGHALVVAGGIESVGAPRLAARAALRVGAGLVTLAAPGSALMAHAGRGPDAVMLRRSDGAEGLAALLADHRRNAVVIGPALGVGAETRAMVTAALKSGRAVVLDADALTSFAGHWSDLADLCAQNGRAVLTPHEGEYAKLFSEVVEKTEKTAKSAERGPTQTITRLSKLQRALLAAARLTAVVVLKGPDTVIAAPDGRAVVNANAPSWLGTAGSGDVLSGLIGGLCAQGFSPYESACCGVFLHGEAGRLAGRGLIADDLPEAVGRVLARS